MQQRLGGVRAAASGSLGSLGVAVGSVAVGGPGTVTHGTAKETSPVFHQFLDAVFQILSQFPTQFEFDGRLLATLHTHSYSCQFGNFLYNTERERTEARATARTHSLWDMINSGPAEFTNPLYRPDEDGGEDGGVLMPDPSNLRYWAALFNRSDAELNGPASAGDGDARTAGPGPAAPSEFQAPGDAAGAGRRKSLRATRERHLQPHVSSFTSPTPARTPDGRHLLAVADLEKELPHVPGGTGPPPPPRAPGPAPAAPAAGGSPGSSPQARALPHDATVASPPVSPVADPDPQPFALVDPDSSLLRELPHPLYVGD
ncbi:MAG: protein-tyrosine phosphatase-like protein [Olpidium bornovanus]|uniref:Protein-tyrosine phosphatase-like protein n=1 Tax=Olpidium bornovanus TaxID=278681 RepID=A0A8H7ZM20_9FUNG|nr:MAG: protein-tyrosine phosphatase-like protein [Olpidium bornovanus]